MPQRELYIFPVRVRVRFKGSRGGCQIMQMSDNLLVGGKYEGAGVRSYISKMLNMTNETPMKYSLPNSHIFS